MEITAVAPTKLRQGDTFEIMGTRVHPSGHDTLHNDCPNGFFTGCPVCTAHADAGHIRITADIETDRRTGITLTRIYRVADGRHMGITGWIGEKDPVKVLGFAGLRLMDNATIYAEGAWCEITDPDAYAIERDGFDGWLSELRRQVTAAPGKAT